MSANPGPAGKATRGVGGLPTPGASIEPDSSRTPGIKIESDRGGDSNASGNDADSSEDSDFIPATEEMEKRVRRVIKNTAKGSFHDFKQSKQDSRADQVEKFVKAAQDVHPDFNRSDEADEAFDSK
jgi:hypothetical protein